MRVSNNRITQRVLRPGDRQYDGYPALPYEDEIDRERDARRRRRRRPGEVGGSVVQLDEQR